MSRVVEMKNVWLDRRLWYDFERGMSSWSWLRRPVGQLYVPIASSLR